MRNRPGMRRGFLLGVCAGALGACASGKPVDPAAAAAQERQVLAAFGAARGIVADRIRIQISPNFYGRITRPATSRELHRFEREKRRDRDVERWVNVAGGLQQPLAFSILRTELVALGSAELEVLHKAPLTLRVVASGRVTVRDGDGRTRNGEEVVLDAKGLVVR